jgi:hypothetical protein
VYLWKYKSWQRKAVDREEWTSVDKESKAVRVQQIPGVSNKFINIIIILRFYTWAGDLIPLQIAQNGSGFPVAIQIPNQWRAGSNPLPHEQSGESDHSRWSCVEIKKCVEPFFSPQNAFTSCIIKLVLMLVLYAFRLPVPVAARSKTWVCGCSLAGMEGSNSAGGMDVCLLWVLCVVR